MIKTIGDRYDIVIPLADLFAMGQDPAIMSRIQSGFFVGTEAVDDEAATIMRSGRNWSTGKSGSARATSPCPAGM